MFIVVHTSPEGPGSLPGILARAAQLPVHNPQPGERIKRGHIYVAKPNHHLLVLPGHVELSRGPRENEMKRRQKKQTDPALAADLSPILDGPPSSFICPECGGGLWELQNGRLIHYRCHVGHAYTAEALLAGQDGAIEEALWIALHTLDESAGLRRRLAADARCRKQSHLAKSYEDRAKEIEDRAGVVREVLLSRGLKKNLKGYGSSKPAKMLSRRTRTTKKS